MKHVYWFIGLSFIVLNCCGQEINPPPGSIKGSLQPLSEPNFSIGLKWNDSLFRSLPKNMDTTIVVQDIRGTSLHFPQYIKPIFNGEAILFQDKGKWKLHRLTKSAFDSLGKEDFAIARAERAQAYRNYIPTTNAQLKLASIAETLAKADHVLVNKSKREMLIKRKGVLLQTFKINMGFSPIGHKLADGDGKTPEGLYHLDLKTDRGDGFYKSVWISYPNEADRLRSKAKGLKPGVGIAIHGTTKKATQAKDWTAGCIALQNKDMDILFAYVANGTPIEIKK